MCTKVTKALFRKESEIVEYMLKQTRNGKKKSESLLSQFQIKSLEQNADTKKKDLFYLNKIH